MKENMVFTLLSRRRFLETVAAWIAVGTPGTAIVSGRAGAPKKEKVAMIHATDLYRPHIDPDDHWDLACVFALSYRGDVDLKGILIDFPLCGRKDVDPDVLAVSQLNFITGNKVPVVVGSSTAMRSRDDTQPDAQLTDHNGVKMVVDILANSAKPVIINITGSCRNIAIAGKQEPALFAKKCAGIYLNAGTGSHNKEKTKKLEYNVSLDPLAYAAIFDLPCPVYWMPCFEEIKPQSERNVMEYGTYYCFRQDAILPYLSDKMQKFFAYMLARVTDHNWLSYLMGRRDQVLLRKFGGMYRNMWCTSGFLHAAGYGVTNEGEIVSLHQIGNRGVFAFEPVRVTCTDEGVTAWSHDSAENRRYIFHVRHAEHYQSAMVTAMKTLLMELP